MTITPVIKRTLILLVLASAIVAVSVATDLPQRGTPPPVPGDHDGDHAGLPHPATSLTAATPYPLAGVGTQRAVFNAAERPLAAGAAPRPGGF
jgi:hypothetical protein